MSVANLSGDLARPHLFLVHAFIPRTRKCRQECRVFFNIPVSFRILKNTSHNASDAGSALAAAVPLLDGVYHRDGLDLLVHGMFNRKTSAETANSCSMAGLLSLCNGKSSLTSDYNLS